MESANVTEPGPGNEARLIAMFANLKARAQEVDHEGASRPHFDLGSRDIADLPRTPAATREREAEALLHSDRWYFALVSSDLGVWDWNLLDGYHYMSDQYIHMLGFEVEEWSDSVTEWSDRIHPDDVVATSHALRAHLDGQSSIYSADFRIRTKSGHYKWVQTRGRAVRWDQQGRLTRMIGTHTDIDERKRGEEQLQQQAMLVENAHDAIFVVDLNRLVTTWNDSADRLFGWPRSEAIGTPLEEVLTADHERLCDGFERTLADGEWSGELEFSRVGGEAAVGDCRLNLIGDSRGKPNAIMAIITDITERKRMERHFFRAQRMESIGTLAGGIAHDLNNVLSPILLYCDMLTEEHAGDSATLGQLSGIESSAKRAADLVGQLLGFARGTEGNRLALRLDQIVQETAKIARETFDPHIQVTTNISDDLSLVEGDPTQLHQVLVNLCVNARDAMSEGGILNIAARDSVVEGMHPDRAPGASEEHYCLVEITDTGHGIEPDILPQIFDPFFTQKPTGTGIGLSSAQSIVTTHGGFIDVQTEPGQGSTFRVFLPAHGKAGDEVIDATGAVDYRGNGEKILVVDDEQIVRKALSQMLGECGYDVLLAADGQQAIDLFHEQRDAIAMVLTDIKMPVMDGPELLRQLKSIDPCVRVVATSGVNSPDSKDAAMSAGAAAFIPKPYTTIELLRTLWTGDTPSHHES